MSRDFSACMLRWMCRFPSVLIQAVRNKCIWHFVHIDAFFSSDNIVQIFLSLIYCNTLNAFFVPQNMHLYILQYKAVYCFLIDYSKQVNRKVLPKTHNPRQKWPPRLCICWYRYSLHIQSLWCAIIFKYSSGIKIKTDKNFSFCSNIQHVFSRSHHIKTGAVLSCGLDNNNVYKSSGNQSTVKSS